jgi:hypothetical protein
VDDEQGLAARTRAPFIAVGHLYFDPREAFQTSFGPHAAAILADIPNGIDIQPTIQISEVKIKKRSAQHGNTVFPESWLPIPSWRIHR